MRKKNESTNGRLESARDPDIRGKRLHKGEGEADWTNLESSGKDRAKKGRRRRSGASRGRNERLRSTGSYVQFR